jgi:uncharacterized protein (TIGR03435 family)
VIRRVITAALLTCITALAQAPAPARPLAFDVVSIRPSKPGTNGTMRLAMTSDGYSVTGQSIAATVMIAYFPQGAAYWSRDRLSGAPAWLRDQYDINAKVSEADLAEWQKQGVTFDKEPMFREMLRTMLADRCHLVAHMVPGPPISGWALELGKHAPHLAESKPDEVLPAGMKLADGGVSAPRQPGEKPHLTFYAATMADLAQILSVYAPSHPVQDHTGLTGHYDFVVDWIDDPTSKIHEATTNPNDPDPLSRWDLDTLGLRYVPIKIPADTLVIDHIEKPSEN